MFESTCFFFFLLAISENLVGGREKKTQKKGNLTAKCEIFAHRPMGTLWVEYR